jgi:PhoPQ-activated pathogenicity-related protein
MRRDIVVDRFDLHQSGRNDNTLRCDSGEVGRQTGGAHLVMAKRRRFGMTRVFLVALVVAAVFAARPACAGLDEYVKKPDPSFAWAETGTSNAPGGTITTLALTSQVWQGITWKHELTVYHPSELSHPDAMLLSITGGDHKSKQNDDDHKRGLMLAHLCGARVAVLRQVPNQPLLGDKKEDELIAETFVRYLQTKDEDWPLLFPMTKSAVRAMDALQAFGKEKQKPVNRFVVTGGSKRGWTTWLTGAVDDRVIAIAPMVIVMLNVEKQGPNQMKVWGKYSEQINDYVERGLTQKTDTPEATKLWKMVDPLTYRDRLTEPKLLVNGSNDRYWTLNALDFYWGELKGPKYLVELPNAGHGLDANRDWAMGGLGAFFRHVVSDRHMPDVKWELVRAAGGESMLTIHATPAPLSARIWKARIGYDLRLLPSLKDVADMPAKGKDLVVVAAVDNVLQFRIFDSEGNVVVDTDEAKLTKQSRRVDDVRNRLARLGTIRKLADGEKEQIIVAVTSLFGQSARSEHRDFRESHWESTPLKPGETITVYVPKVSVGHVALFGELEYKIDGIPYHLTTSFLEPGVAMPVSDSTKP